MRTMTSDDHRDDFVILEDEDDRRWFAKELKEALIVKVRGLLGSGEGGLKEITLLSRIVRHDQTANGSPFREWEADPRHATPKEETKQHPTEEVRTQLHYPKEGKGKQHHAKEEGKHQHHTKKKETKQHHPSEEREGTLPHPKEEKKGSTTQKESGKATHHPTENVKKQLQPEEAVERCPTLQILLIFFSFFHVCDFFTEKGPGGFGRLSNLPNLFDFWYLLNF